MYPPAVFVILLTLTFLHNCGASQCLSSSEILTWNRHLYFDKKPFALKLAATDDPVHQLVNHIYDILARERLGYRNISFVQLEEDDDIGRTIAEITCTGGSCNTLPNVHLNLLLWLPSGININHWAPPSTITDHGPLGPTRQWELRSQAEFSGSSRSKKNTWSFKFENSCSENPSAYFERIAALLDREVHSNESAHAGRPVTVYEWTVKGSQIKSNMYKWNDPPVCGSIASHYSSANEELNPTSRSANADKLCRTESYQAIKVSWANLSSISPPLHKLASRIYLADYDYEELRRKVAGFHVGSSSDLQEFFHDSACSWLRRNPTKWMSWTEGWNQKLNLTVAWISDNRFTGLSEVAGAAIALLNHAVSFFRDTEYALKMVEYCCEEGTVLNEYFKILAESTENRLVATLAAIPSDRMESVVELSNLRRKLILSPTVATAQFLERRRYPYFFRTIPAMTQANYILLRLFLKWNWRRLVLLRKRDHFFNARLFQAKNIEIIDVQMEEQQLTYKKARHSLENLKKMNSRIFVVEYEAIGTYRVLCAAYHLGMHFDAGYVWFLNPWLTEKWWEHESLSGIKECTHQQMANISSFTFSVGHQWMIPNMFFNVKDILLSPVSSTSVRSVDYNEVFVPLRTYSSSRLKRQLQKRDAVNSLRRLKRNGKLGVKERVLASMRNFSDRYILFDTPNQSKWYQAYTADAVIALGVAVVNLLKKKPWALFELDTPHITETLRDLVSQASFAPINAFESLDQYFLSSTIQHPLGFHFNAGNERVANHWVVKQRQGNATVPIFWWSVIQQEQQPIMNNVQHDKTLDQMGGSARINSFRAADRQSSRVDAQSTSTSNTTLETEDLLNAFDSFERHMSLHVMDKVNWSRNGGPPQDGSSIGESCAFPFLSNTLKMGCTGATVFVIISVTLVCLVPVIVACLHYRRKLLAAERLRREVEYLTRKPFDDLCKELADLDIPMEAIVLNRHIGQGAFGLVFGGEVKANGTWEAVAVKVLNEDATYDGKIDFLSEAKLMRSLEHRNVVRLIGISLNLKNTIYLIMELMLLGDLKTYLLSRRILAQRSPDHEDICPSTLTKMSMDIAEGVRYLHGKNLIHRDIACRNCLVAADRVVKIGDFGLTRGKTTNRPDGYYRFKREGELPLRWMSPEAMQHGIFTVQSDVWSYGITLYEIVTFGVFPYSDIGDIEVVERVIRMEFSILDFLPASARDTVVWNLIRSCCQYRFSARPSSMDQVLQVLHDYPECVRPFLTDQPPKPSVLSEPISPFQRTVDTGLIPDTPISNCPANGSFVSDVGRCTELRNLRCSSVTELITHPNFSQLENNTGHIDTRSPDYHFRRKNRFSHSSLVNHGDFGNCFKPMCSTHGFEAITHHSGHSHYTLSSSSSSSLSQYAGSFLPHSSPQTPNQEVHQPLLLVHESVNAANEANHSHDDVRSRTCSHRWRPSGTIGRSLPSDDAVFHCGAMHESHPELCNILPCDKAPSIAGSLEPDLPRCHRVTFKRSRSMSNLNDRTRPFYGTNQRCPHLLLD